MAAPCSPKGGAGAPAGAPKKKKSASRRKKPAGSGSGGGGGGSSSKGGGGGGAPSAAQVAAIHSAASAARHDLAVMQAEAETREDDGMWLLLSETGDNRGPGRTSSSSSSGISDPRAGVVGVRGRSEVGAVGSPISSGVGGGGGKVRASAAAIEKRYAKGRSLMVQSSSGTGLFLSEELGIVDTALKLNGMTRADVTVQAFGCLLEQARR